MRLIDYQEASRRTAIYPGSGAKLGLLYVALGLAGEAGELCNQVKKIYRDDGGFLNDERRRKLAGELGGVMWYLAGVAHEARFTLEQAEIQDPKAMPETAPPAAQGTAIGLGYVAARLSAAAGKLVEYALYVMPYKLESGEHWSMKGTQGRTLRQRLRVAVGAGLYYADLVAKELNVPLANIMASNVETLANRQGQGTLMGDGDERGAASAST